MDWIFMVVVSRLLVTGINAIHSKDKSKTPAYASKSAVPPSIHRRIFSEFPL